MFFSLKLLFFYISIKLGTKGSPKASLAWGIGVAVMITIFDYFDYHLRWYQAGLTFLLAGLLLTGLLFYLRAHDGIWSYLSGIIGGTIAIFFILPYTPDLIR
jgi:hypothetical protein